MMIENDNLHDSARESLNAAQYEINRSNYSLQNSQQMPHMPPLLSEGTD